VCLGVLSTSYGQIETSYVISCLRLKKAWGMARSEGEELQKGGRGAKWRDMKVANSKEEDFSDEEEARVGQEEQLPY
jgi:hypothetical protein